MEDKVVCLAWYLSFLCFDVLLLLILLRVRHTQEKE